MTQFEYLLYEKTASIAYITFNRPQVLNALNKATLKELKTVIEDSRDDANVRGVILTGSGDKAFAAGADIGEMIDDTAAAAENRARYGQAVSNLIENIGKPVIAAVNGFALGGGCEIAMACSIRLGSENAKFGQPEVKLGLIPGYGGTQRLPRLIGKGLALQLILSGDIINAQEAYRIGLINEIVPSADLINRAETILQKIIANAPLAVKFAIEAVNSGLNTSQSTGMVIESSLFGVCASTKDKQEGISAFLKKRPPQFRGE